jgi:hypothetical protein
MLRRTQAAIRRPNVYFLAGSIEGSYTADRLSGIGSAGERRAGNLYGRM